jgi:hypothetical protein
LKKYKAEATIELLEPRKGGYYFIRILAEMVDKFTSKKQTRLICAIDKTLTFQCGLNHLGDGNFFIILNGKNVKLLNKNVGSKVNVEIIEDPNPLGVEIPEVLLALLEQDDALKKIFDGFTMGKKRSLIHGISRIKDLDKKINTAINLINNGVMMKRKKEL